MIRNSEEGVIRVVQITDTHLFREPDANLLKLNTQDSFEKVLELIQSNESAIDVILATGDIAQDASVEAYMRFGKAMEDFDAPFYWIPGNHDRRRVMQGVDLYKRAFDGSAHFANWQFIFLDSSVTGEVHGLLGKSELAHLAASLEASAKDPALEHCVVCLHHNPVPGSAGWMEGIGLQNDKEFFALIDRYPHVRAVVYGHIHQELDFVRNDVRYFCTPSTCIQFKPQVEDFTLDNVNPAYRWFDLLPNGEIRSAIERVTGYEFEVDHSSTGY